MLLRGSLPPQTGRSSEDGRFTIVNVPPAELMRQVQAGQPMLDCRAECSGAWGQNRQQVRILDATGRWQALALLVLCRILFGGFGVRGAQSSNVRRRIAERWEKMTPKEREKYRQSFCGCWGSFQPPEAKPSA